MAETSEKVRHAGPPEIQRTLQGWGKQRLSDKLFSESHYYSFICIRQSSGASTTPGYGQEKSEAADQLVVESTRITDIAKLIGFLSENNDSDFTILCVNFPPHINLSAGTDVGFEDRLTEITRYDHSTAVSKEFT